MRLVGRSTHDLHAKIEDGTDRMRRRERRGFAVALLALALAAPCSALAQAEALRSCLSSFEGIPWRFPYRPALQIHRCTVDSSRSTLELIGALRLGPARDGAPADASYAQLQQAVFFHFDELFQRSGFRRVDVEQAEDEGQPYVTKARYARGSATPTLTWQTSARNTWLVTLDKASAR